MFAKKDNAKPDVQVKKPTIPTPIFHKGGGVRIIHPPAKHIFGYYYNSSIQRNITWYIGLAGLGSDLVEGFANQPMICAGRFTRMKVIMPWNTLTGNTIWTMRKNLADTALQITVPASNTSIHNAVAVVPVIVDDFICVKMDTTASALGDAKGSWALEFMPT